MDYNDLQEMTKGKVFPLMAKNEEGDPVIIREGVCDGLKYYEVKTLQKNNWIRVNCYYEDGSIDETYER